MPNTPVRAAATGLPNSRRAVLGAILAGAAVAAIPAASALASPDPDAALFALQADIEAADLLDIAALKAQGAAEEKYFAVRAPRPAEPESLTAAKERADETTHAVAALRDRVVTIQATTLAGLKFKARYAVEHFEGAPDEKVIDSIVDDLLAMSAGGHDV